MRKTETYIALLRQNADKLKAKYGITMMCLFGSVARGEQHEGSDVDIFVDMPPTLRQVGGAEIYLRQLLGCDVDLIRNHKGLTPLFRKQIEQDGINVF
ncbi:MAG: nucleotidyltransferase family protein [Paludibacteraceae bacterium]|nr:nucleotidyltransferase family protein [Paludibacteraceae bacterium]